VHSQVLNYKVAKTFLKKIRTFLEKIRTIRTIFEKKSVQSVQFLKTKTGSATLYSKLDLLHHILNWVCKTMF